MVDRWTKGDRSLFGLRLSLMVVLVVVVIYAEVFYALQVRLYDGLHMTIHDIQMANQVLFNTLEGRFFENNYANPHVDMWAEGTPHSILEHHLYLILLLILPFYYLFPDVYVLFFIQSLATACGGLALYLIAKHVSQSDFISVCLAVSYLLYPTIQGMTLNRFLYGFHPDILFPTFLLFAFYFFLKGRMGMTVLFSVMGLLCAEHLSLTVAMFGLYLAMVGGKSRRPGILIAVGAGLWIVLSVLIIIPHFRGAPPRYISELLVSSQTASFELKPAILLGTLYTKYLFLPLAFTFLLDVPSLVLALPGMMLSLASRYTGYSPGYDPFSWRMAQLAPFLFLSTTLGVCRLHANTAPSKRWIPNVPLTYGLAIVVLLGTSSASMLFGPGPWSISTGEAQYSALNSAELETLKKLKAMVSPDASFSADPFWGSHFTARRIIHPFPIGWDSDDFVLVTNKTEPYPRSVKFLDHAQRLRTSGSHRLVLDENGVRLYQRINTLGLESGSLLQP